MHGNGFRRPNPYGKIRVVRDLNDSTQDYFISLDQANVMLGQSKLRPIKLQHEYQPAYQERKR